MVYGWLGFDSKFAHHFVLAPSLALDSEVK